MITERLDSGQTVYPRYLRSNSMSPKMRYDAIFAPLQRQAVVAGSMVGPSHF